ncbi:MAG: hypothetical protein ACP5OH_05125 [Nitrososphaerota archaeon]
MPEENIEGPTILWSELDDKKVKSNDGEKLGKIKKITPNHFRLERGSIRKKSFWLPKNVADAFDGEYLWLSSNEEQIHNKYLYGEEPPIDDKTAPIERVKIVKERMAGIPSKPKDSTKPYKNVRDLK